MLLLKFFRFLFGYVSFTAQGGFPERFINLCDLKGITMWDVRAGGGTLTGFTDRRSYKKMRAPAKSSGMKLRIARKYGFTFFADRHSRRAGVIAGMLIMISLLWILSTRLWSIDVSGCESTSPDEILSAFEKAGVKIGVPVSLINASEKELEVMDMLPQISWLNINLRGSSAHIEVREVVGGAGGTRNERPANIVAGADGMIVIFRAFNGAAEAKAGIPVLKGDLLISGMEENRDLSVSFCRAEGYIVAETEKKISSAAKRSFEAVKTTEMHKKYSVGFFGLNIPLGKISGGKSFSQVRRAVFSGVTLPLDITERISLFAKSVTVELSESRCRAMALSEHFSRCAEALRYVEPESIVTEISGTEDGFSVICTAECFENIGVAEPFDTEDQLP